MKTIFYRTIKILSLIALLGGLGGAWWLTCYLDLSMRSIPTQHMGEKTPRLPVYLVSYGDGHEVFYQNQNMLTFSALNKGIDFFLQYRREHIDPVFAETHKEILSQKSGAGLWLWKPYIILKTMQMAPENSIIIYLDSGFTVRRDVQPLIDLANEKEIVLTYTANIEAYSTLERVVSRSVLEKMHVDRPDVRDLPVFWGGMIFLKNTPRARAFIKKWLELCSDLSLIKPAKHPLGEYPKFEGHSADQALLGALYATDPAGKHLISFEELNEYLFWHHRHPTGASSIAHQMFIREKYRQLKQWLQRIVS